MRILLLGEYSNLHNTLAKGLRQLGHSVTVASNGDRWKNFPRDIDLSREDGVWGSVSFLWRLAKALPRMRGYDIVQLINPEFFQLRACVTKPIYDYLRHHNRKVVMGAFGMDYYWVNVCDTLKPLRYSDFNFGERMRDDACAEMYRARYVGTDRETLNRYVAQDCDAIVSCLYEYQVEYSMAEGGRFRDKLSYIPLPIEVRPKALKPEAGEKVHVFIGISKYRSEYKGTDIMLRAAKRVAERHQDCMVLDVAEGVPFAEYEKLMDRADVVMDQLYSYTPAMNGLLAMSKGKVLVGGGEPENYEILGEQELRPIVNVLPSEQSVYDELERLVTDPERIARLKEQSVEYVARHHEYIKVARQYEDLYKKLLDH